GRAPAPSASARAASRQGAPWSITTAPGCRARFCRRPAHPILGIHTSHPRMPSAMTALPRARAQPPDLRPAPAIRPARAEDLEVLLELENRCFEHDRLSRRSFRHFLASDTASCLVAERDGELLGYALVLFHGRTALARLYSMAVAPEHRGQGLGRVLLEAAEATALDRGAAVLRLEVHPHNDAAIALYRSAGYVEFGIYRAFYEDDSD